MARSLNLQHGEVSHRAEPAEALSDDAPFALLFGIVGRKTTSNRLAVTNDVVCTEMLQILRLLNCIALQGEGTSRDGRAETRATLV